MSTLQFTVVRNDAAPLCKEITLVDGAFHKQSHSKMTVGTARRVVVEGSASDFLHALAETIMRLDHHEALISGTITSAERDKVRIVVKGKDDPDEGIVARTLQNFSYVTAAPALLPIDFDRKDMPEDVKGRIGDKGLLGALARILPQPRGKLAALHRASTTSGIRRSDTSRVTPAASRRRRLRRKLTCERWRRRPAARLSRS
jgi:hypothetical protein